jgi:hypothetical protein
MMMAASMVAAMTAAMVSTAANTSKIAYWNVSAATTPTIACPLH